MKRRLLASKRDVTGLACLVGMGLLVLIAWATLPGPPQPDLQEHHADPRDADGAGDTSIVSSPLDLPGGDAEPIPPGKAVAAPSARIEGSR